MNAIGQESSFAENPPEFNHFYLIPKSVARNSNLPPAAKLMWGLIYALSKTSDGCFVSNQYVADSLGISTRHVRNCISRLVEEKLIVVNIKTNGNNITKRILKLTHLDSVLFDENKKRGGGTLVPGGRNSSSSNSIVYNNSFNKLKEEPVSEETEQSSIDDFQLRRSFRKKKTTSSVTKRKNPLLEYWNELSNVPKHTKTNTKVYAKCSKMLYELKSGVFFQKYSLNKNGTNYNNLPKKWGDAQIKLGLKNLSLCFMGGYWPEDKTHLPNNLPDLIYNPRTRKSTFFSAFLNQPTKLDKSDMYVPKVDSKLYEWFVDQDICEGNELDIRRFLKDIQDYQKWILNNTASNPDYIDWFRDNIGGDEYYLIDAYVSFLQDEYPNFDIHPSMLGPKAKNWAGFLKYLSEMIFNREEDWKIFKRENVK